MATVEQCGSAFPGSKVHTDVGIQRSQHEDIAFIYATRSGQYVQARAFDENRIYVEEGIANEAIFGILYYRNKTQLRTQLGIRREFIRGICQRAHQTGTLEIFQEIYHSLLFKHIQISRNYRRTVPVPPGQACRTLL